MEQRKLGRTDINVSALCLGTMMYGDQIDVSEANRQMDESVAHGINFFDTAELYTIPPKPETQGASERIVGNWINEKGNRDKIVLATKVTGRSPLVWIRDGKNTRVNKEQIISACERSLKNMQTDYIDLYQIHWPDRGVPAFGRDVGGYYHYEADFHGFEEALRALDELVQAGKVRHVGLSNETPYGTMKYLSLAEQYDLPRMVSIQNAYNLTNRAFEYGLAEIAMEEQVGLLAYSPIGQGALTGKYLGGAKPDGTRGKLFGRLERYETPSADLAIKAYVDLANELGIHPAALAMQFVTTRPWVTSNIFGASNKEQLDIIFQSLNVEWTEEINEAVNNIHMRYTNPCP